MSTKEISITALIALAGCALQSLVQMMVWYQPPL
jgi:hypothetical protein